MDGITVSLKQYTGSSPLAVLKHASKAEASADKAHLSDVMLYVEAKNVSYDRFLDFAAQSPLTQIPGQSSISVIYVQTAGGWIKFTPNSYGPDVGAEDHGSGRG